MADGKFYRDRVEIAPGILLYRRAGSKKGIYQYRLAVGDKHPVQSTHTSDRQEAEAIARAAYAEAQGRHDRGAPVTGIRFAEAAGQFLAREVVGFPREKRAKYEQKLQKHLVPFFGSRDMLRMDDQDIRAYLRMRKASESRPAASTLNSELAVFRAVFRFAENEHNLREQERPHARNESLRDQEPRTGFTKSEFKLLRATAYRRFREARHAAMDRARRGGSKEEDDNSNLMMGWRTDSTAWHRYRLYQFILIMGATGMRPRTLWDLTWADVEKRPDGKGITLKVMTRKGGRTQPVRIVPGNMAQHAIQALMDVQEEWPPYPDGRILPVGSFKKSFSSLLDACGLTYNSHGTKRTIYSLRHYYITMMLLRGVSTAKIAANTLTSEAIIQRYYNHMLPLMVAEELSFD